MAKAKKKARKRPDRTIAMKGNKYALGHHCGRPEIWTQEVLSALAIRLRQWMRRENSLYVKTFCYEEGFLASQAEEFCAKSNDFSEAWRDSKEWQEQKLVYLGLTKKTSEGMTKFVLANVHHWREKTELSGDQNNPLAFILQEVDGKSKDLVKD